MFNIFVPKDATNSGKKSHNFCHVIVGCSRITNDFTQDKDHRMFCFLIGHVRGKVHQNVENVMTLSHFLTLINGIILAMVEYGYEQTQYGFPPFSISMSQLSGFYVLLEMPLRRVKTKVSMTPSSGKKTKCL